LSEIGTPWSLYSPHKILSRESNLPRVSGTGQEQVVC